MEIFCVYRERRIVIWIRWYLNEIVGWDDLQIGVEQKK